MLHRSADLILSHIEKFIVSMRYLWLLVSLTLRHGDFPGLPIDGEGEFFLSSCANKLFKSAQWRVPSKIRK
jgi:hypothetical protein